MNTSENGLDDAKDVDIRRPRIVRTALLLGSVALLFYIGFIAIGVLRS